MVNLYALKRKFDRLRTDPVLRAWLLRRAVGLQSGPAPFAAHMPPYAWERLPLAIENTAWNEPPVKAPETHAEAPVMLQIAGVEAAFDPADPEAFFDAPQTDIEVDLARHRFAWIALQPDLPAAIFHRTWQAWRSRFFPVDGMHWHPYTAAERAINVIDAARRFGTSADTDRLAADLAHHAKIISERLEYFGEHDTSNHLANNGRGLYRIGCAIGDENTAALGFDILTHEAERIFLPGGMLREGSSHYQFLYLRNYIDVWLCAERHGRSAEAETLKSIAGKSMQAARAVVAGERLPLIGDISPDCPPGFLLGLEQGECAWTRTLDDADRDRLRDLAGAVTSPGDGIHDGWLRARFGRWSVFAHVPNAGWPFMPGHAHQDMGSAEIHVDGRALFVDPGRGAYGETGDAALYRSSAVHGTLRIDNADPYPPNKPYYDDAFRTRHAGPAAAMLHDDGITVAHGGYRRLGADDVRRRWTFTNKEVRIDDGVSGRGTHVIERTLVTPLAVRIEGTRAIIGDTFALAGDVTAPRAEPVTIWHAYNNGMPGTRIVFETRAGLPWSGTLTLEETS